MFQCEKKVKTPGENIQPKETELELVGGHDDDNENFMNRISKICKQVNEENFGVLSSLKYSLKMLDPSQKQ